jgi:hypothetical protein
MADAKFVNKAAVWQRFAKIPDLIAAECGKQLAEEVDGLVQAQKRACPVSVDLEKTPGELRASIHAYANPDRPMSYRVIADARDDKGEFIGPHVEFGHLATNGRHVPPKAFFFPTYRARKKAMRRRMLAAARRAIKKFQG